MKKSISIVLASALALGACAPGGGITPPSVTPGPISSGNPTVDAIVADAVKGCGFLPTIETAAAILSTFVSGASVPVGIADTVAKVICRAVLPAKSAGRMSMRAGENGPVVNGVPIEGRFIR